MNYALAQRQFAMQPQLLFVRFEQGRGHGGVPKTWLPYMPHGEKHPQVATLVQMAVAQFRAQCADPIAHGRDLMPAAWEDYELHNIDGGRISTVEEIRWESVDNVYRAELVLTWRNPAELLIELAERGSE